MGFTICLKRPYQIFFFISVNNRHELKNRSLMRLNDFIFFKNGCLYFIKKHRFLIFDVKFNVYYEKMTNLVRARYAVQNLVKL